MVLTGAEPVRWDRKENLHPPALLSLEKVTPDPCSSSICPKLVSQTPLVWPKCFSTCCCFFAGTRSKWICMWVLQKQSLVSPQFSSFPIICPTGSQSQVLRGLFSQLMSPRLGCPTQGSDLLFLRVAFCDRDIPLPCESLPWGIEFWVGCITAPPALLRESFLFILNCWKSVLLDYRSFSVIVVLLAA